MPDEMIQVAYYEGLRLAGATLPISMTRRALRSSLRPRCRDSHERRGYLNCLNRVLGPPRGGGL